MKARACVILAVIVNILLPGLILGGWNLETIDDQGNCGQYNSLAIGTDNKPHVSYRVDEENIDDQQDLAIDKAGNIHLVYFDQTLTMIKYGLWNGSQWTTENIQSANSYNWPEAAIVADSANKPHIVFYDANKHAIIHAFKNGSAWTFETIADGDSYSSPCIYLDSSDNIGIAFTTSDYLLKYAYKSGNSWNIIDVDTGIDYFSPKGLAFSHTGQASITYIHYDTGTYHTSMKYAEWNGISFDTSTVVTNDFVSQPKLSFDSDNNPLIIYTWSGKAIRSAHWNGASWDLSDLITTNISSIGIIDIAIDQQNNPVVIFADGALYYLKYTTSWTSQVIDSTADYSARFSLVLNNSDIPFVVYHGPNDELMYAQLEGSSWSTGYIDGYRQGLFYAIKEDTDWVNVLVDSTSPLVSYTSIKLDQNNNPSIGYFLEFHGKYLKIAKKSGSTWIKEQVSTVNSIQGYVCLALKTNQNPSLTFIASTRQLAYGAKESNSWIFLCADSTTANTYNSLVLDTAENPCISYYDGRFLKYTHYANSTWTTQSVDTTTWTGLYNSLALDSNGYPHIAYQDSTAKDLMYAYWNGTGWIKETVDSGGSVGSYCSLALDHQGNPLISYYDATNGDLKYARKTDSTWRLQVLDTDGGQYTCLKLDSNGDPRITYFCGTTLKYAYFTNTAPLLSWTQETHYTAGAVYPVKGLVSGNFAFRVRYTDAENDAPDTGYPKIHIKKGGVEISGSPFIMTTNDESSYEAGRVYKYSTALPVGTDYSYYCESRDQWEKVATGAPTTAQDAPDVYTAFLEKETSKIVTLDTEFGQIKLEIPPNGFDQQTDVLLEVCSEFVEDAVKPFDFKGTNIGLYIYANYQPSKELILTLSYRDSDVIGMNEEKLRIVYYDPDNNRWVLLPGSSDPVNNKVTGKVKHCSTFRLVELTAAENLDNVSIYPNPFLPARHTSLYFVNLTSEAEINIYTLSGELVRELKADLSGTAVWDGKNENGETVASGVYFALFKGNKTKIERIAVER